MKHAFSSKVNPTDAVNPLADLDEWEEDLKRRYPQPADEVDRAEGEHEFRDYAAEARPSVREFYRLNHRYQTVEFVQQKRDQYLGLTTRRMNIWEALEFLNTLVDDSDPDIDLAQIEHLLQTSEAIRADGHPRWMILAGLVHDLGKVLCLFGEPQWAVVGDTFPVGCRFSDRIVFHEFFDANPDHADARYNSRLGIYEEGCGLEKVLMSWGHDEYIYHAMKDFLPEPALYMLRYHSFYPAHREGAYDYLMNDHDREMFRWVKLFNRYDLYTKSDVRPDVGKLRPYYEDLTAEYLPEELAW
jgi:inositol oxygenase